MRPSFSSVRWGLCCLAVAAVSGPAAADGMTSALKAAYAEHSIQDLRVVMAEQADTSACAELEWGPRGQCVVDALTEVADRTQASVKEEATNAGLEIFCFIAGNECEVRGAQIGVASNIASLPGVAEVGQTFTIELPPIEKGPMPEATTTWGLTDVHAPDFWTTWGKKGDGILVANIDTGVQWDHVAFAGRWNCGSDPTDPKCWLDPSNVCPTSDACDNVGHGTHTMGTMTAGDDPSLTYTAGMAPNAKFIACKGCESGSCSDFALNSCADWILAPGGDPNARPNVVNNSWGGGGGDNWYQAKVTAWRDAGIFPAFSAGNAGPGCGTLGSPGDYQESFGSAAHDSGRTIASFSSRGPSAFGDDPYTKPNVSAPGVGVWSTVPNNGWASYNGTSMASPHTAGAVALLWSCNSAYIGDIDGTIQALQNNADTPPAGSCGAPPDGEGNYTYGYGYLNVLTAGDQVCGPPQPQPPICDQNGDGRFGFRDVLMYWRSCDCGWRDVIDFRKSCRRKLVVEY